MVLLAYALIVSSQVREISVISDAKKKGTNQSTRLVLTIPSSKRLSDNKVEEYVLYRDIIRKYSWYEGVGTPISQETANHLPFYYKLSMKNNHGHWQHIEAMHQNEMTSNHSLNTYVLDKRNDNDNNCKEWIDKLKTVAQWFITSDLSGNEVVEERGAVHGLVGQVRTRVDLRVHAERRAVDDDVVFADVVGRNLLILNRVRSLIAAHEDGFKPERPKTIVDCL